MIEDIFDSYFIQENKIAWEDIRIFYRNINRPKQLINPTCKALDTETLNGYVKLITDSEGRFLYCNPDEPGPLLQFLCYKGYRDSLNFFFNIQYDFDSIIKSLPEENIKEIVYNDETVFEDYKISYIPKKLFSIAKDKHACTFFDVAQFYEMSLEQAAALYLGKKKNPEELDRALIGTSPEYWEEHKEKIERYCELDSFLTAGLGQHLVKTFEKDIKFSPGHYTSKASIAKQYVREYVNIPNLAAIPEEALYYAFNAYYGGRFEVTQKGNLGESTLIDIKSAYPYEIAHLINTSRGAWKLVNDMHENAYYGFYRAKITVNPAYICPYPFRQANGTICYPWGEWLGFCTKQEIEAYSPFAEVEVIRGYEYYPKVIEYPFKEMIEQMYYLKSITPKADFKYSLYKILMNSLYGCFFEKIKQPEGYYKAGILFNPVFACLITANTRIKAFLEGLKYGKNCAAFATDSVLVRGILPEMKSEELGDFSTEDTGPAVVVRPGVYRIGEKSKNRGIRKPESRGIKDESKEAPEKRKLLAAINPKFAHLEGPERFKDPIFYYDLYDYITGQPELIKYSIISKRPVHLKEAVKKVKKYSTADINLFKEESYDIDLNVDNKRRWAETWKRGGDIFKKRITSEPLFMMKVEQ